MRQTSTEPTDAVLLEAYARLQKSSLKVAAELGICASTVCRRLARLGVERDGHQRSWTKEQTEQLKRDYADFSDRANVQMLADQLGKPLRNVIKRARSLGLQKPNGRGRQRPDVGIWRHMDMRQAGMVWDDFKGSRMGLYAYCKKHSYHVWHFKQTMKRYFGDEWEHVLEMKVSNQSLYRIGRALEYRVRDHLERFGYVVLRSPGSKSPLDLCAIRAGEVLFVQCKKTPILPPKEWNALLTLASSVSARPLMASPHVSGRGIMFKLLLALKTAPHEPQQWREWQPETHSQLSVASWHGRSTA